MGQHDTATEMGIPSSLYWIRGTEDVRIMYYSIAVEDTDE
jgi:hypothetical protein